MFSKYCPLQLIKIKHEVITTLNVAHLFNLMIIIFQHNPHVWRTCPMLAHSMIIRKCKGRHEWMQMQEPNFYQNEIFKMCQIGTYPMRLWIMAK
jgi:hypothetical protein